MYLWHSSINVSHIREGKAKWYIVARLLNVFINPALSHSWSNVVQHRTNVCVSRQGWASGLWTVELALKDNLTEAQILYWQSSERRTGDMLRDPTTEVLTSDADVKANAWPISHPKGWCHFVGIYHAAAIIRYGSWWVYERAFEALTGPKPFNFRSLRTLPATEDVIFRLISSVHLARLSRLPWFCPAYLRCNRLRQPASSAVQSFCYNRLEQKSTLSTVFAIFWSNRLGQPRRDSVHRSRYLWSKIFGQPMQGSPVRVLHDA